MNFYARALMLALIISYSIHAEEILEKGEPLALISSTEAAAFLSNGNDINAIAQGRAEEICARTKKRLIKFIAHQPNRDEINSYQTNKTYRARSLDESKLGLKFLTGEFVFAPIAAPLSADARLSNGLYTAALSTLAMGGITTFLFLMGFEGDPSPVAGGISAGVTVGAACAFALGGFVVGCFHDDHPSDQDPLINKERGIFPYVAPILVDEIHCE